MFCARNDLVLQCLAEIAEIVAVPSHADDQIAVAFGVLLGGVQLLSLGVIGAYLARIHNEVRGRPLYITREQLGFKALPRPAPSILEFLPSREAERQEVATSSSRLRSEWSDELLGR